MVIEFFLAIGALEKSTESRLEQEEKTVTGALLDLSTAFDSTNHAKLLRRLDKIDFDEQTTSLIENYLSNRTQQVVLNEIQSDWITLKRYYCRSSVIYHILERFSEDHSPVCTHFSFYIQQ